jgi:hypothetical protein
MESTRNKWTDERMDDFARHTQTSSSEVRAEIRDLRKEMTERFASLEAKFDRRFDLMFGAMVTGFVGLILTHFIG